MSTVHNVGFLPPNGRHLCVRIRGDSGFRAQYFYSALDRHFPGMKQQYIQTFGNSYQIQSPHSAQLYDLFLKKCSAHVIVTDPKALFAYMAEFPEKYYQMTFDEILGE